MLRKVTEIGLRPPHASDGTALRPSPAITRETTAELRKLLCGAPCGIVPGLQNLPILARLKSRSRKIPLSRQWILRVRLPSLAERRSTMSDSGRAVRCMGRVAEGSHRNYETLRLGIQNLFPQPSIIIGPASHGQFLPLRLKVHMPLRKFTCRLNG